MRFFVGLHQPADAARIGPGFISVNRLRSRKGPFEVGDWIMDSGAFSTIATHKGYPLPVSEYAEQIRRWKGNGNLLAAVAQDWMCEPHMIAKTGLDIVTHQLLTIARYVELLKHDTGVYIMPVLQGYAPEDYVRHLGMYGDKIGYGAWVGVGSVCKRNSDPRVIERVLWAIKEARPDLKLHGFGLKSTALSSALVVSLLHTADSMAWSFAARKQGRNANDWREAAAYVERINSVPRQFVMEFQ